MGENPPIMLKIHHLLLGKKMFLKSRSREWVMLKMKLQYFGYLIMNQEFISWYEFSGKDLDAGKEWRKQKGMAEDEMVSVDNSMNMNLSKLWEIVKHREIWCASVTGVAKVEHDVATKQKQQGILKGPVGLRLLPSCCTIKMLPGAKFLDSSCPSF